MVNLEVLDEIIEELADLLGVYGDIPEFDDHPDDCRCRMCFSTMLDHRIRQSIRNEELLKVKM